MDMDRRRLLLGSLTGAAALATPALAAPLTRYGLDGAQFGVRPGAPDDQSIKLQRAIDHAAQARVPLVLAPGVYRAGGLTLPAGAQIFGVRGATRLSFTRGPSLMAAEGGGDNITLSGLVFDGGNARLPQNRGVNAAGGNGIMLTHCDGDITRNTIAGAADNALFCVDSLGLVITANTIRGSGNGGIGVWQSDKRRDGSLIADNTIEDTHAHAGGTGQNGNAIAVFRAGNVIVRGNHIRNAAFSAIRGNSASNIQIIANSCIACDDVALYSEFEFEGAIIADNMVDGAGSGISVTNFNFKDAGRLAAVRGNILRNLKARAPGAAPEEFGLGIGIEAETTVSDNVIENAQTAGIRAGWGPYLRNVAVTGNVLRRCGIGVAVSVVNGAGPALIASNLFADVPGGAIVGMKWTKAVTGDLAKSGAAHYPQLTIANNQTH
jgi:uncharacterized secreted repeat protein (TIGR03808 family)